MTGNPSVLAFTNTLLTPACSQHGEEAYVTGEGAILVTAEAGIEGEPAVKPA